MWLRAATTSIIFLWILETPSEVIGASVQYLRGQKNTPDTAGPDPPSWIHRSSGPVSVPGASLTKMLDIVAYGKDGHRHDMGLISPTTTTCQILAYTGGDKLEAIWATPSQYILHVLFMSFNPLNSHHCHGFKMHLVRALPQILDDILDAPEN